MSQLKTKPTTRAFRALLPTNREVLLARLLLSVCDSLWEHGAPDEETDNLYNEIKSFAEGVVRGTPA